MRFLLAILLVGCLDLDQLRRDATCDLDPGGVCVSLRDPAGRGDAGGRDYAPGMTIEDPDHSSGSGVLDGAVFDQVPVGDGDGDDLVENECGGRGPLLCSCSPACVDGDTCTDTCPLVSACPSSGARTESACVLGELCAEPRYGGGGGVAGSKEEVSVWCPGVSYATAANDRPERDWECRGLDCIDLRWTWQCEADGTLGCASPTGDLRCLDQPDVPQICDPGDGDGDACVADGCPSCAQVQGTPCCTSAGSCGCSYIGTPICQVR